MAVLFTDVTDSWKLAKRSQRLMISFAGVYAELIIAGLSLLGWVLTDSGPLQSVFFVLSTVTIISTLFINLNPAMRFDGYYLLSDLWGIDNLQSRSFAVARWKLREWFLGLKMASPEDEAFKSHYLGMVIYSVFTWIYRLFLYTAIALLVYYYFTKTIGITLFIAEIVFFIVAPFYGEFKRLKMLKPYIELNKRLVTTLSCVSLVLLWFVLPWPHSEEFAAVTVPVKDQVLFCPTDGKIASLDVRLGQRVEKGDSLIAVSSMELEGKVVDQYLNTQILESEINIYSEDDELQSLIPEKQAELATAKAELRGLLLEGNQNKLQAQIDGIIYELDEHLYEGLSVSKDQPVGRLAELGELNIVFFVPEDLVISLEEQTEVSFRLSNTFDWYEGTIESINPVRTSLLPYPQLGSVFGGSLPVVQEQEDLVMVDSYYEVRVKMHESVLPFGFGQTGQVSMRIGWRSKMVSFVQMCMSVFLERKCVLEYS